MRVLITRSETDSVNLIKKMQEMGASAESFPVIAYQETPLQTELAAAIQNLKNTDMAIFVSKTAVQYTFPLIKKYYSLSTDSAASEVLKIAQIQPLQALPGSLLWASVGPSTGGLIKTFGIPTVIFPTKPPYESESLLAMPPLQNVNKKNIIIFRGNGGRDFLGHTLQSRGAVVNWIETYQRILPKINSRTILREWRYNAIDVIVTTSAAGLNNLVELIRLSANIDEMGWFKSLPLVVVGLRTVQLAHKLGFKQPLCAEGAEDDALLAVLRKVKEKVL